MEIKKLSRSNTPKSYRRCSKAVGILLSSCATKPIQKKTIIELLEKGRGRTKAENKFLSDHLSQNIDYFAKLTHNPEDIVKLEKLVSVIDYEIYLENTNIITFGEEGDKFYVLLEGTVGIYVPTFTQKTLKLKDYVFYMQDLEMNSKDKLKLQRIIDKNSFLGFDYDFLTRSSPESYVMKKEYQLFIEEDVKIDTKVAPFSFGDIALIKKAPRNATIKAHTNCRLATINKYNYTKIIGEIEEKRLEQELRQFKQLYPLFENWSLSLVLSLHNMTSKQIILQGDYLYKQNSDADCIYIIRSGKFEVYSMVSFGWINEFLDYIITPRGNLIEMLNKFHHKSNDIELYKHYQEQIKKGENSPCIFDPFQVPKLISDYQPKEELDKIHIEQDMIANPYNLFKVHCRKVNNEDVLGLIDSFEIKKRFSFVKCISSQAEVSQIKLFDFLKLLIANPDNKTKELLIHLLTKRKLHLFKQIRNAAAQRNEGLGESLRYKYSNITKMKYNEDTKLKVMKLTDKDFFDFKQVTRDIIEKLAPVKEKSCSINKHMRTTLLTSASCKVIPSFINKKKQSLNILNSVSKDKEKKRCDSEEKIDRWICYSAKPRKTKKCTHQPKMLHFEKLSKNLVLNDKDTISNYFDLSQPQKPKNHNIHTSSHNNITTDLKMARSHTLKNLCLPLNNNNFKKNPKKLQVQEATKISESLTRNHKRIFLSKNYHNTIRKVFQPDSPKSYEFPDFAYSAR